MDFETFPMDYGLGFTNVVNDKLKTVYSLRESISSEYTNLSLLDEMVEVSYDDLDNLIETTLSSLSNKFTNEDISYNNMISNFTLCNGVTSIIQNRETNNDPSSVKHLIECISDIKMPDDIMDDKLAYLNNQRNYTVCNLNSAMYKLHNVNEQSESYDVSLINSLKSQSMNEAVLNVTTSNKIYSTNIPNGTNVVGKTVIPKDPNNMLSEIMSADSEEQFIHRLRNLTKYIDIHKYDISEGDIVLVKNFIKYAYSKLIVNNTGLNHLKDNLYDCKFILDNVSISNLSSSSPIEDFKNFLDGYIDKCENREEENENEDVIYDSDILAELGFGFIYEYPESDMTPEQVKSFNENMSMMPDTIVDECMSFMNEVFGAELDMSNVKNRLKFEKDLMSKKMKYQDKLRTHKAKLDYADTRNKYNEQLKSNAELRAIKDVGDKKKLKAKNRYETEKYMNKTRYEKAKTDDKIKNVGAGRELISKGINAYGKMHDKRFNATQKLMNKTMDTIHGTKNKKLDNKHELDMRKLDNQHDLQMKKLEYKQMPKNRNVSEADQEMRSKKFEAARDTKNMKMSNKHELQMKKLDNKHELQMKKMESRNNSNNGMNSSNDFSSGSKGKLAKNVSSAAESLVYNGRKFLITNTTARKAVKGIKRGILALAGGAVLGGPTLGMFAAAIAVLSAFKKSNKISKSEKDEMISDIQAEIKSIDQKMSQMDDGNKAKTSLARVRGKLESLLDQNEREGERRGF